MTLDPNFLYPIWPQGEQRRHFEAGHITYMMPHEMNRTIRRKVEAMEKKRTVKPAANGGGAIAD